MKDILDLTPAEARELASKIVESEFSIMKEMKIKMPRNVASLKRQAFDEVMHRLKSFGIAPGLQLVRSDFEEGAPTKAGTIPIPTEMKFPTPTGKVQFIRYGFSGSVVNVKAPKHKDTDCAWNRADWRVDSDGDLVILWYETKMMPMGGSMIPMSSSVVPTGLR